MKCVGVHNGQGRVKADSAVAHLGDLGQVCIFLVGKNMHLVLAHVAEEDAAAIQEDLCDGKIGLRQVLDFVMSEWGHSRRAISIKPITIFEF